MPTHVRSDWNLRDVLPLQTTPSPPLSLTGPFNAFTLKRGPFFEGIDKNRVFIQVMAVHVHGHKHTQMY